MVATPRDFVSPIFSGSAVWPTFRIPGRVILRMRLYIVDANSNLPFLRATLRLTLKGIKEVSDDVQNLGDLDSL